MPIVGFHASHELYPPGELLRLTRFAEAMGFRVAMCSDHLHPWTEGQGQSGFAWSWLGAALQGTRMTFGTVCAPGQRYHPAVVAQAAATLAEMFPNRFWLAVGTGQNLNEHVTGDPWPSKPDRRKRLEECVGIVRRLWAGETVDHDGLVRVRAAKLYSRPERPPRLFGAAITEDTAEWVGSWADGLITVAGESDDLQKVVWAFRRGGGVGKPVYVQAAVSLAADDEAARRAALRNWPVAAVDLRQNQDLPTPADFDRATAGFRPEDLEGKVRASADPGRHADWLRGDFAAGVDAVYLHHVGPDPERFIRTFAQKVLPKVGV